MKYPAASETSIVRRLVAAHRSAATEADKLWDASASLYPGNDESLPIPRVQYSTLLRDGCEPTPLYAWTHEEIRKAIEARYAHKLRWFCGTIHESAIRSTMDERIAELSAELQRLHDVRKAAEDASGYTTASDTAKKYDEEVLEPAIRAILDFEYRTMGGLQIGIAYLLECEGQDLPCMDASTIRLFLCRVSGAAA